MTFWQNDGILVYANVCTATGRLRKAILFMDRVLVLDFDGVLNDNVWFARKNDGSSMRICSVQDMLDPVKRSKDLNPEMVERLNQIVEATKCEIVICSSWRIPPKGYTNHNMMEFIKKVLSLVGFRHPQAIVSSTPIFGDRSDEIMWHIKTHGYQNHDIVILDDFDMKAELKPYHVQTSFWHPTLGGLTSEVKQEVIKRFNENPVTA